AFVSISVYTRSLHDALPIYWFFKVCEQSAELLLSDFQRDAAIRRVGLLSANRLGTMNPILISKTNCRSSKKANSMLTLCLAGLADRKSTRLNSSHVKISYAV